MPPSTAPHAAPSGHRWCARCKRFLLFDSFSNSQKRRGGYCRQCNRSWQVERQGGYKKGPILQLPVSSGVRRCSRCGIVAVLDAFYRNSRGRFTSWCKLCVRGRLTPEMNRVAARTGRAKRRTQVLAAYGNVCACCSETTPVFLAIDHIAGGGTKHRKTLTSDSSHVLYQWLKRNDYPPGFQVLCHNCNWAKHALGRCPHQPAP